MAVLFLLLLAVDSRFNRPIEAGSGEGRVLRWDAEGEAGGGAAHRGRARRLWRWAASVSASGLPMRVTAARSLAFGASTPW